MDIGFTLISISRINSRITLPIPSKQQLIPTFDTLQVTIKPEALIKRQAVDTNGINPQFDRVPLLETNIAIVSNNLITSLTVIDM
jgi:hypothetical protein